MPKDYFYEMVKTLREKEEVILHENILLPSEADEDQTVSFLREEFKRETLDYPFKAPEFNDAAAWWAAQCVYIAAQLILYRKNEVSELEGLFPKNQFLPSPSSILSVDLCLRFIPDMIRQLNQIDHTDPLISLLEKLLHEWHYSGINYTLPLKDLNFDAVLSNLCTQQLYANRVISFQNLRLAGVPNINSLVKANLGIFQNEYWPDFKPNIADE